MDDFSPEEMREFNENLNAMNATMGPLSQALNNLAVEINKVAQNQSQSAQKTSDDVENLGNQAASTTEIMKSYSSASKKTEETIASLTSGFKNATEAVHSFSQAILTGEDGFKKYSVAMSQTGDAVRDVTDHMGPLGRGIGIAVDLFTKLAGVMMTQTDQQNQFVKDMNAMGAQTGLTSDSLTDLARNAGYAASDLDKLTPIINSAASGLATFGEGTATGTKKMLEVFALSDESERQMRRLGMTLEEANEQQAFYIQLQRTAGINLNTQNMTALQVQKRSLDYTKTLRELSELTGKSASQLKEEQAQIAADIRNKIRNMRAENEIISLNEQIRKEDNQQRKAELEARRDTLVTEQEMRSKLTEDLGQLSPEFAKKLMNVIDTGAFDESTKQLATVFGATGTSAADLSNRFEGLEAGSAEYDAAVQETIQEFATGVRANVDTVGSALEFMGDGATEAGDIMGVTAENIDAALAITQDDAERRSRIRQGLDDATEKGADSQKDAAAGLQVFERNVRTSSDAFLDSINVFNNSMAASVIGIGAMTAAAYAAAAALAKIALMGGPGALGKMFGKRGGTPKAGGAGSRFLSPRNLKIGGGVLAAGYGIYEGFAEAGERTDQAQIKYMQNTADLDLTTDEGKRKKLQAQRELDFEKGEARTVGASKGIGAGGGGLGGAALGAAIGTAILPGIGTALGGLIGGALGAWAGSELGEIVGEKLTEAEFNALEIDKDSDEYKLMSEEERTAWADARKSAEKQIELAQEQLDVQKQNLKDAHSSGLYDHDWIGDSEVNFEVLAEMRDAGTLQKSHLEAIIAHKDIDDKSMELVQKELDKLNEIEGNTKPEEEKEEEEKSFATMTQAELFEHFSSLTPEEQAVNTDDVVKEATKKLEETSGAAAMAQTGQESQLSEEDKKNLGLASNQLEEVETTEEKVPHDIELVNEVTSKLAATTNLPETAYELYTSSSEDPTKDSTEINALNDVFDSFENKRIKEQVAENLKTPLDEEIGVKDYASEAGQALRSPLDTDLAAETDGVAPSKPVVDISPEEVPEMESMKPAATTSELAQTEETSNKTLELAERQLAAQEKQNEVLGKIYGATVEGTEASQKIATYAGV